MVVGQIETLLDSFAKQFQKYMPNVAANDKAKNIMRSIIRVIELLSRTQEIEGITRFSDFFKEKI